MIALSSMNIDAALLLNSADLKPTDHVLILGAEGLLVEAVARQVNTISVYDQSFTALKLVAQRRLPQVTVMDRVFPVDDGLADVALIITPKGRHYARALLWSAFGALRPGGKLYITGANDGGVKTALTDAQQLFERVVTLQTRQRHRIGVAVRQPTTPQLAYPSIWGDDPTTPAIQRFDTPRGSIDLYTMPGIFSWEHLDAGTALLLDTLEIDAETAVLDVGCGGGIIGMALAGVAARVLMTDDNLLAVRCAQASIALNALGNITAQAGDVYSEIVDRFDLIVSNPPFHQGLAVTTETANRIIREASAHLNPGGRLCIVANAFLGYERIMAQCFQQVQVIAQNSRYAVIQGM